MVRRRDYSKEMVAAAQSVLIELVHLLGEYREQIVLVGGWVPKLICPNPRTPHVGSIDVDIALDHRTLGESGYRTIGKLLLSRGYQQGGQPFIYNRLVSVGNHDVQVEVDLLGAEYGGTGRSHRTQRVQDVRVRKARGADLALNAPVEVRVEGCLPDGGKDAVKVRVTSIVPFIVMKAMALDARLKEKDSYDIYYCLINYPGGIDAIVNEFRPHIEHGLVREALQKLDKCFSAVDAVGPKHVADFEDVTGSEERDLLQRDAYERIRYLLKSLGM
jgi:hypothetical protein